MRRVRVIRTGVDFQLAVHRLAHLRLGQHSVHCILDQFFRLALTHEARAFFAQPTLVAAVLPVDFLVFLAAGELDLRRVAMDLLAPMTVR